MEISFDALGNKTTFVTYMGGDAYGAPAIWHSEQASATTEQYFYLFRDYLGSIMAITDSNGTIKEKRHFDAWGEIATLQDGAGNNLSSFTILDRGYTGHEHLLGVGLVHMNGRLYDPKLHRFLMPDNYVQDPYNTQNFNRYGYVLNNPLSYTDASGEFLHIIVGALIGGVVNLAIKALQGKINSWGDGFAAFGIGAAAGAIGAATGGIAFTMAGGAAGGVGGFLAGAAGGAVGTAFASPVQSLGNHLYFGDPFLTPKQWVTGIVTGGVTGGLINGGIAAFNGRNFWNGDLFTRPQLSPISNVQTQGLRDSSPYERGKEGLKLNNIKQNTERIESLTNTAEFRVSDEMIRNELRVAQIGEVKHYSLGRTVSYTKQLKDFVLYADKNEIWFQLYIPQGVNISQPLQSAINQSQYSLPIIFY